MYILLKSVKSVDQPSVRAILVIQVTPPTSEAVCIASHGGRGRQKSLSKLITADLLRGGEDQTGTHCRGSAAMGNSQDKPPESGGGLLGRPSQRAADGRARSGGGMGNPQKPSPPEKGLVNGRENSPTVDTSYLNAPAGALPPHLARLKNEGNHLFRHGQFGDALEKYSRAIEGFPGAGARFYFFLETKAKWNTYQVFQEN